MTEDVKLQRSAQNISENAEATKPILGKKRSSKTMINFWLDAGMLVLFVALGIVAVIVQFVFPPGIAARGWTLWGLSYGSWCSLQFGLLCVMALAVLIHVMLHWTWICGVVSRQLMGRTQLPDNGVQTILGVGLLIVLLNVAGVVVAIARFMINAPADL
ncbi:MAG: DUF4405 domain-containing protein [Planctomycetaceae bacterium]